MRPLRRKTAGELANKALSDQTKYKALDVGHGMTEKIDEHIYKAARNYREMIGEDEYCVVMLIAEDPLIKNVKRRKFYCWPYLPSPRPNQAVFLYNKKIDRITKRLWVLPNSMVMAELASLSVVHKRYKTMQAWSVAFFEGKFWEYIRYEHDIDLLSETEYLNEHREELIKAGCQLPLTRKAEPFDFSKIHIRNVVDTLEPTVDQNVLNTSGQT